MNPDLDALLFVWNMLDNPLFTKLVQIILPSVKFNNFYFIKRTEKEIDIKLIEELCLKTEKYNPYNDEENKIIYKLFNGEKNKNKLNDNLPLIKKNDKDNKTNENYVKIFVYNYQKLKFNSKIIKESDIKDLNNIKEDKSKKVEKKKTIMIHVHGGGFVAMSRKSHENYTLKWANNLKIPIFSIDYRLSPGVAFPKSLDDVYQSYMWIIKYSKSIFNIEFDEIIIAGDSAGGNLILSLTYLLIMNKIKLPKVIFMFYPALKIDINTIVPSYLNAMTDIILEYHLLKYCIGSYSGIYTDNGKVVTDTRNKFLSPIFMDDNILKLLPPIRIFGGSCDVLRDDTFYLMEKLLKLNKDIFFYEFKYFPHGYLNYDFKSLFPECSLITDKVIKEIEKYIE
jgi:hormone-sensitive lipase